MTAAPKTVELASDAERGSHCGCSDLLPVRRTILSACRQYRYTLWREWKTQTDLLNPPTSRSGRWPDHSYAMFIGLNPSTADETKDDPTIRKCVGFAKRWGFAGLCMTNLFAWRATKPEDMKRAENPSGEDNQHHILQCASTARIIIAAWGKNGSYRNQDLTVMQWLGSIGTKLHCLRTNGDGSPEHPLYVPYEVTPKPYGARTGNAPDERSGG